MINLLFLLGLFYGVIGGSVGGTWLALEDFTMPNFIKSLWIILFWPFYIKEI